MKRKTKSTLAIFLSIILLIQSVAVLSVSAVEENIYEKMVNIANQEVGYMETTYSDGTFTSKYGEWYGIPNGAWCAMFCSWCANQAGISTEVLPKFASCHVGMQWFKNKNLWKEKTEYNPEPGDLVFLNDCTHVGIVEKYDDGIVYTIEGNACDDNKENYGVRKRFYSSSSSKITGYGLPDKSISAKFNGKATKKETAYMLPDTSSQTVWEVWENDDLEILCKDGTFYLVMYPFLSTGKFVCAYVPETAVTTTGDIPNAIDFYKSQKAFFTDDAQLYHNPSDTSLMSNAGVDKKVRAEVKKYNDCQVLFEKDGYYFVKTTEGITGFIQTKNVEFLPEPTLICGDLNWDNQVTISDTTILQQYLAKMLTQNQLQLLMADTNADNKIDVRDATEIQRYVAKIIDHLPYSKTESENIEVSSIGLPESVEVAVNENVPVHYQIFPENATNKQLIWLSFDESVATVTDEGIVTGKMVGNTKIFAVAANGTRASVLVTVKENYIPVESVTVNNPNLAPVNSGTGIQLSATVSPNNATDKGIEWTSSNPDIASVDKNGYVTTKSAGTVSITATSLSNEKKATTTVKVNQVTSYIPNGNYCFKLKGTNSYLDHQGGGTHGTNVHLWSGDGNSNANQKIKLERIDDNRYKLWSAVSTNLMLDVNRGNSYSDPLKIGLNVDIWENNDWEAQEWLFTKTYDGYYIIRLNMLQEGAMEASGTNNGDNIFYGTYNCDNDRQKWELVNTSEYHIPETKAWVCNTGSIGNVHVRSGPGSGYTSIGGFNEGQEITILGDTNAEWLKVRGANRHNGETIEGYSHRDYYTTSSTPVVRERDAWICNTSPIGNVNVRQGPDTGYNSIGGFNEGQKITVIGELNGSWYNVRGIDRHSGNTIEGYTHSDYITFNEPQYNSSAPNLYSSSYNNAKNPFAQNNYYGQCTWYAWGRANEVTGKDVPCRGDARTWYSTARNNGYSVGSTPRANSIAVWSNGTYGHVAYVESVNGDTVTITESNWDKVTYSKQYTIDDGIKYYSGYKNLTNYQMSVRCGTLLGYIYL